MGHSVGIAKTIRQGLRVVCFALVCGLGSSHVVAQNFNVASELALGISAFNNARYGEAALRLQRVVTVDPGSVTGHFYLAQAYDKLYAKECAGNCVANERRRQRATEEFNRALELEPSLLEAMKAIARRYQVGGKYDEADRYYRSALAVDPNDFETLHNLAVLGWTRSYGFRQLRRADRKLGEKTPLIHSRACHEVRNENLARVEESIVLLERADTVMQSPEAQFYLNLLYRERADIQCGNQSGHDQDVNTAIEWGRRACETRHHGRGDAILPTSLRLPSPASSLSAELGSCPD